ncbi:MAG: trehalose-phosphatase, partial [Proteobacteria bacterium]|nr:trehalose-phosphatase [Burkholderiales bacterium]
SDAAQAARTERALDQVRTRIAALRAELAAAGVDIEDKRYSIALHYRLARDRDRARRAIGEVLRPLPETLHAFGGKCVENVVAADAPDKAVVVERLVAHTRAGAAVFVGDDVNDEPVFTRAPLHWLTVRVGRGGRDASRARYFLESTAEVALMLDRMLALAASTQPGEPGPG